MDHAEIDIRSAPGVLRRQFRIVVITFVSVVGLALAILLALPSHYRATALILIDPNPQDLLDPELISSSYANDNARVENEVEILRSDPILIAAIEKLELLGDPAFNPPAPWWLEIWPANIAEYADDTSTALEDTLIRLRRNIEIERRGLTYVIAITARSPERVQSAELANTIAQAYIQAQLDDKITGLRLARQVLENRLEDARQNLLASEMAIDDFMTGFPVAYASGNAQRPGQAQTDVPDRTFEIPLDNLPDLYQRQHRAQLARTQYQALITRSAQLDIQSDTQIADSRLLAAARPPATRSFPDIILGLGFAGLVGLGLGIGAAFTRERIHGGFVNARNLSAATGYPVLAEVPNFKPEGLTGTTTAADALVWAPLSRYSESIRLIRAGVDQAIRIPDRTKGRTIMVTSPSSEDGKSSLALALARTYALSGAKTLLIDCDLRFPSQYGFVGVTPNRNFHEHLRSASQPAGFSDLLVRDPHSSLSMLMSSHGVDEPTDQLLSGQSFASMISLAQQAFDYVIIDAPAIGAVVDGLYLARYADMIVVTIRWAKTRQIDTRDTLTRLEAVKGASGHLMTVLNRTEKTSTPADIFTIAKSARV